MNYPYFLKPSGIDDVISGKYLDRLTATPRKPEQPYLEDGMGMFAGALIYIGGSVLLLCIVGMFFSKESGDVSEVFKIIGGAALAIIIGIIIGNSVREGRKQDFERKQSKYAKEKAAYERQLSIAQETESNLKCLGQSEKLKYLLTHYFRKNSVKPELSHSTYKEGKSEQMFYTALNKQFGENILKGYTIVKDYIYETSYNSSFDIKDVYLPDFVYHNPKSGISIDIEIDERTEKTSGKVIHKFTDEKEMKRDTFFNKNGWFVLRFAEEQILNNTNGCIAFIITILNQFDPEFIMEEKHKELLTISNGTELAKIVRW